MNDQQSAPVASKNRGSKMHYVFRTNFSRAFFLSALVTLFSGCFLGHGSAPATSTADFLGPDDFQGDFRTKGWNPDIGGQTDWIGSIAVMHLPRTTVDDVLPSGLSLAPNTTGSADHPIVTMIGDQTNLTWVLPGGITISPPGGYQEMILFVPFVTKDGGNGNWHNFVVRMYLNWQDGVTGGNAFYGYQKELAEITKTNSQIAAIEHIWDITQNSTDMLDFSVTGSGSWMDAATATTGLANFAPLKQIFEMPMLGRLTGPLGSQHYICSYFIMGWQNAQLRREQLDYEMLQPFTSEMSAWVAAGEISNVPDGGFGVDQMRWELTAGLPCIF